MSREYEMKCKEQSEEITDFEATKDYLGAGGGDRRFCEDFLSLSAS